MSSEILRKKRSLSVNQRLLTLGGAALMGFCAMIAVAWYQNTRVAETLVMEQDIGQKVAIVNELRSANLEMVLAAMDAIVDKDEGVVAPQRIVVMKDAIAKLREKGSTIETITKLIGKPEMSATLRTDIDMLEKAMLTDLPALVASRAGASDFAGIDDTIDGAGEISGT